MGRRRWRFVIAACLLFVVKDTQTQDDNDFYYSSPVERNFAQVQPPLFPNSRPTTYFEQRDGFRVPPPQQPLYNEESIRFPNPFNNQNPGPFQHTGRSQSSNQYYVNQPEFIPSRQRFRPAPPYNFQLVHPASTKKPDVSLIHSLAYQHDPSKPEQFLGQITLNNPDLDYLHNRRFKNIPFDGNSLKSNGQSGHITHDEDVDSESQDFYDNPKVTTYNPNKQGSKLRLNITPKYSKQPYYDYDSLDETTAFQNQSVHSSPKPENSNDKSIFDLEPLLEDNISDIGSFRELMKNTHGSLDVQVINSDSNKSSEITQDSKPDASSMNTDNFPKNSDKSVIGSNSVFSSTNLPITTRKYLESNIEFVNNPQNEENEEYVEYYDETESPQKAEEEKKKLSTIQNTEHETDIYDEYDASQESEITTEAIEIKQNKTFTEYVEPKQNQTARDGVVLKPNNTTENHNDMEKIDTDEIDQFQLTSSNKTLSSEDLTNSENEEGTSLETPSILGQEVVSVVTTKSVVNGTISIPEVTFAPSTTKIDKTSVIKSEENDSSIPTTTENYVVVASVQTSRSVSGARFLPFPTVEQDEKKQMLADGDDEEDESMTIDPFKETSTQILHSSSTENINDKLDSIQSELSSSVLSGTLNEQNGNIEHLTETTTEQIPVTIPTAMTTQGSLNVFTLKSTQPPVVTEKSSPEPLPVMIKKFTPRISTSTTPKPKKKLVTVMDDLAGFLPPGYKPRLSFKDKRVSTTTTTTSTTPSNTKTIKNTPVPEGEIINETQGRSSGISSKNKVIILDDKSLIPKEYKINEKPFEDLFKNFENDDINKFLPPGFTVEEEKTSNKMEKLNISVLLNKNSNLTDYTTTESKLPITIKPVDITAFLPPGYRLNTTKENKPEIPKFKVADISSLLPPGFKFNDNEETTKNTLTTVSTTNAPSGFKLVFPSRPGGKITRKTTQKPKELGPPPVTPMIQKGWPTRVSTEFTGWPTSSTTPFSIEKYLNMETPISNAQPPAEVYVETTTKRAITTTTTTQPPPPPTTPGVCKNECDIAATIKIVSGVKWIPELLDHHTEEWQKLAKDVKKELNNVYSKSDELKRWYKGIRIDGFSKGSVLVDYFIELKNVEDRIDSVELKKLFHKSLPSAKPGSVIEIIDEERHTDEFDPDVMLGDQPVEYGMKKSNEKMTKTIDKSVGKLEIGKFVMDPAYTEFIVLPKREEPSIESEPEEESFLPQWGIAVIVIAMASLLFVVIFGVTVLVNRQKSAKAKQPIPLSEDMLKELDKSHMGGYDDMHQMKERDLPYPPSGKRMSTAFIEQLAYANPGDSWRSEWTPQMQKYMQHYTPDSGRGSQVYGASGNPYGYGGGGGSQIYGETGGGGGGSQVYGYTGEYPRTHYSRRRSHYDSNF